MARGDHWWNEPPWWAWATMAISLVALVVLVPLALNRTPADAEETFRTTPAGGPSTASENSSPGRPAPSPGEGAAQVLVIGDVDTGGFASGSVGWPAVLEERLPDVEMTVATTGDAGYATTGSADDATIPGLVGAADLTGTDVIVLFGSRYDAAGIADRVEFAVTVSIAVLGDRAPDAELVVIGPVWPDDAPPAGVRNNRDVIRLAAETAGVVFVDPIAEGWLVDVPELVGPDGEHLTAEADAYLADRIEPVIRQALAA